MNSSMLIRVLLLTFLAFKYGNCEQDPIKTVNVTTKCFQNLGCIKSDDFFDTIKTVPLVFSEPETMNVTFNLFTRQNPKSQQIFSYKPNDIEITSSLFSAKRKTKFIIHGYFGGYESGEWMDTMKNYFLNNSDYNVFAVDWSKAASSPNYFQSAVDTRIVGRMVAYFINRLINATNATPKDIHCAGHSLGAHTCGFAGKQFLNPRLNEITGMDPAGPGFLLDDIETRLDATDADLVLIIHTNAGIITQDLEGIPIELTGILGNPDHLGHFDFWPNGGSSQPSCTFQSLQDYNPACNHGISHDYPTSLSNNSCQYIGYECDNYVNFQNGKCAQTPKPMEYDFDFWDNFDRSQLSSPQMQTQTNDYYLKTSDSEPYCLFHYQILVQIAEDSKSLLGRLEIALSSNTKVTFPQPGNISNGIIQQIMTAGKNYTQLYLDRNELELKNSISVKWTSFGIFPKSVKIEKISINFMSHIDKSVRQQKSKEFCLNSGKCLNPSKSAVFKNC